MTPADDPTTDQARAEYAGLLVAIGEYYHHRWKPVDRLLMSWVGALAIGLIVLILSGDAGYAGILGGVITGASAAAMAVTAFVHSRRTRVMLDMHQRALSLMQHKVNLYVVDVENELHRHEFPR